MKRIIYKGIVASLALLCCTTSCQKDNNVVRLSADFEQPGTEQDQKTFVYHNMVNWNTGDKIEVNGKSCEVHQGVVEAPVNENGYAALYTAPYYGSGSLNGIGSSCTGGSVTIPDRQTFIRGDYGLQKLDGPMVARFDGENGRLQFRNLYSVIKIKVKNPHIGRNFYVTSIRVTASHTNLAGTMTFSLSGDTKTEGNVTVSPITSGGKKMITLTPYGDNGRIASGADSTYYIFCAPVSNDTLKIEVTGYPDGYDSQTFEFQKAGSTEAGVTLRRSDMGNTMVDMEEVWPRMIGKFSVSPIKQVIFSSGNLQYNLNSHTWRFAPMGNMVNSQLPENFHFTSSANYISEPAGNVGANYISYTANDGWMSLFGWGATGAGSTLPYMTTSTATNYYDASPYSGPVSPRMANTNYDWGVNCSITNPLAENPSVPDPAGTWRMLSQAEWQYMVINVSPSRYSSSNKELYTYVKVHFDNGTTMTGLIIYPDGTKQIPDCITSDVGWHSRIAASITQKEFEDLLYFVGCAFLPMYGDRETVPSGSGNVSIVTVDQTNFGCHYWTASDSTASQAIAMYLKVGESPSLTRSKRTSGTSYFGTNLLKNKCNGYSVRLVKDVQ